MPKEDWLDKVAERLVVQGCTHHRTWQLEGIAEHVESWHTQEYACACLQMQHWRQTGPAEPAAPAVVVLPGRAVLTMPRLAAAVAHRAQEIAKKRI